ncbi:MAG: phosphoribosylglycinamide formyltransferase [Spirosomataceae bacterium]
MKRLAIFASGSGSNAEKIADYFRGNPEVHIELILCNNPKAGVIERASRLDIPLQLFDREQFRNGWVLELLKEKQIDWIILAGFLWLIPSDMVRAFPNRMVNLHPALLPKFGGKGMYGHFVHEAVVAAGEKESGITIHFVNEHYDEGNIIFQAAFEVSPTDTPDDVARKGQRLEHEHFPKVIGQLVTGK